MRVHMPNSLFQNQPCNPCWHFTSFLSSLFAHQTHSLIWVLEGRCSWLRHSILHMESDACCLERRWVCSLKVYIAMMRCNPHKDHGSFAGQPT
jgi:hypothetical protein